MQNKKERIIQSAQCFGRWKEHIKEDERRADCTSMAGRERIKCASCWKGRSERKSVKGQRVRDAFQEVCKTEEKQQQERYLYDTNV